MKTASFTIADVSKQQRESGGPWLQFLGVPKLSMGVYHLPVGTDDRDTHTAHDRDEVYVGVSGNGRLTAADETFYVEAGAIVYVKAGVEHHFHDVTDNLTALVFFSGEDASDE